GSGGKVITIIGTGEGQVCRLWSTVRIENHTGGVKNTGKIVAINTCIACHLRHCHTRPSARRARRKRIEIMHSYSVPTRCIFKVNRSIHRRRGRCARGRQRRSKRGRNKRRN